MTYALAALIGLNIVTTGALMVLGIIYLAIKYNWR